MSNSRLNIDQYQPNHTYAKLLTCIRRVEAVIAAVASDFDLWWVFFVGVVNVAPVAAGETGEGNA